MHTTEAKQEHEHVGGQQGVLGRPASKTKEESAERVQQLLQATYAPRTDPPSTSSAYDGAEVDWPDDNISLTSMDQRRYARERRELHLVLAERRRQEGKHSEDDSSSDMWENVQGRMSEEEEKEEKEAKAGGTMLNDDCEDSRQDRILRPMSEEQRKDREKTEDKARLEGTRLANYMQGIRQDVVQGDMATEYTYSAGSSGQRDSDKIDHPYQQQLTREAELRDFVETQTKWHAVADAQAVQHAAWRKRQADARQRRIQEDEELYDLLERRRWQAVKAEQAAQNKVERQQEKDDKDRLERANEAEFHDTEKEDEAIENDGGETATVRPMRLL